MNHLKSFLLTKSRKKTQINIKTGVGVMWECVLCGKEQKRFPHALKNITINQLASDFSSVSDYDQNKNVTGKNRIEVKRKIAHETL